MPLYPSSLADWFQPLTILTFQYLAYVSLQGKLPLWGVSKEAANIVGSIHGVFDFRNRTTEVENMQHNVCRQPLGKLCGACCCPFLPWHLPHHKSAHEGLWLEVANQPEVAEYGLQWPPHLHQSHTHWRPRTSLWWFVYWTWQNTETASCSSLAASVASSTTMTEKKASSTYIFQNGCSNYATTNMYKLILYGFAGVAFRQWPADWRCSAWILSPL